MTLVTDGTTNKVKINGGIRSTGEQFQRKTEILYEYNPNVPYKYFCLTATSKAASAPRVGANPALNSFEIEKKQTGKDRKERLGS